MDGTALSVEIGDTFSREVPVQVEAGMDVALERKPTCCLLYVDDVVRGIFFLHEGRLHFGHPRPPWVLSAVISFIPRWRPWSSLLLRVSGRCLVNGGGLTIRTLRNSTDGGVHKIVSVTVR